ncbi:DUF748 domain-containing protein [Pelagibaculum spongiae]|uniref:DUF748 domain-containing protein n=1 Tax=Pelagibaculum spongiae TaxID=2080658 RepID=A0A2V1GSS1_9GAMM|nr:DUF748 domain-containing protein [Pelagibaculum spongiae]PVZ68342.1 hypothetical protein DC094_13740 [Pelagibaculum spongiae]
MKKTNKILASSLAVTGLLLWGLPEAIRFAGQHWLTEQGFSPAKISDIDLNLFAGTLSVTGLEIGRQGKPEISIGYVAADLNVAALFRRQIHIAQLSLKSTDLQPTRLADGRFQLAFVQPEASADAQVDTTIKTTAPVAETTDSEPWQFGIDQLMIDQLLVSFTDQQPPKPAKVDFKLQQLALSQLYSWQPAQPAQLKITAQLNQTPLELSGQLQPFASPIKAKLNLQHQDLQLAAFQPWLPADLTVSGWLANALSVDLAFDPEQSDQIELDFSSQPVLKKLQLTFNQSEQQSSLSFDHLQLNVDGDLKQQQLTVNPELTIKNIHLEQAPHTVQLAELSLKRSKITSDLKTEAFNVLLEPLQLQQLAIATEKQLQLAVDKIKLQQLSANKTQTIDVKLNDFSINQLMVNHQQKPLTGFADFSIQQVEVTAFNPQNAQFSASLEQLALNQLVLQQAQQNWLQLNALSLDRATFAPVTSGALTDTANPQLNTAQPVITLGSLQLKQLTGELQRQADGAIPLLDQWLARINLIADNAQTPESVAVETVSAETAQETVLQTTEQSQPQSKVALEEKSGLPIVLQQFHLDGAFKFTDLQAEPNLKTMLQLTKLDISDLNTADSEHFSPIALAANIGEYGEIIVDGEIAPISQKIKLKGEIKNIELPIFTGYIEPMLGYQISLGQLNNRFELTLADQNLQLENNILLKQLEMEPVDQAVIDRVSKQLTMPIDKALSFLRNSDNNIELSLPVAGPLDDLSVDTGDIIATATTNAIKEASISYLKHLLQPWGTAITLAQYAGELLSEVSLDPVAFDAGSSELNLQGTDYLGKLALLTQQRPDLQLKLCGVASNNDRQWFEQQRFEKEKLEQQLLAQQESEKTDLVESKPTEVASNSAKNTAEEIKLAEQQLAAQVAQITEQLNQVAKLRGDGVKRYLVEQQGIDPGRLLLCKPKLENEALPSVAVGI